MEGHPVGDSMAIGWPACLATPESGPYRAVVVAIHDGDTLTARTGSPLDVSAEIQIRLFGVNAPELSTPEGVAARDFVREQLPVGSPVRITLLIGETGQPVRSFTRFVGTVEYAIGGEVFDLAADLVREGHGVWCGADLKPRNTPLPPIPHWRPA